MADAAGIKVKLSDKNNNNEDLFVNVHPKHKEPQSWTDMAASHVKSNKHGGRIYTRSWFPKNNQPPRALVFLTHGVNEHIGRYSSLAHLLVQKGYGVLGHDHIGHGLSDGFKGDIEDWDNVVGDFKQLIRAQRDNYPDLPFFVLAHSMGSIAGFHATYELEIESPGIVQGVIFSGCALVPGPSSASPFGVRCLFCLSQNETASSAIGGLMATLQPRGPLAPVFLDQLTHDKAELDLLSQDALHNTGPLLNRTGNEILKGCRSMKERLPHYTLPFIALHGSADTVTYPLGSQILFDQAGSVQKSVKFYPGMYHEILMEIGKEAVIQDVSEFLDERLKKTEIS